MNIYCVSYNYIISFYKIIFQAEEKHSPYMKIRNMKQSDL